MPSTRARAPGPLRTGTSLRVRDSTLGRAVGRVSNQKVKKREKPPNSANKDDGTGGGVRIGYAKGPLDVAVATGSIQYAAGNSRQTNAGLKYDFGVLQLLANVSHDEGLIQASAAPRLACMPPRTAGR